MASKTVLYAAIAAVLAVAVPHYATAQAATDTKRSFWNDSAWKGDERGFHYYPDPNTKKPSAPAPAAVAEPQQPQPKQFDELKTTKEIREEHDRLLDVAVVSPTEENVLAYHRFKTRMLAQSEVFSSVSQAVIWKNPDIDYNATNPTANFAQQSQRIQKNREEEQLMRDLSTTHGIVFFFRSSCPACHAQAPILRLLTQRYGIEVLSVSLDGGVIEGLPNMRADNGISAAMTGGRGIEMTPMTFLVSRDQKDVIMLGAGLLAEDDFLNRVRLMRTRRADQLYVPYWAAHQSDAVLPQGPVSSPQAAGLRTPEKAKPSPLR
jgi:conjugal transfer pilus assembly protein TraF